MKIKLITYLKLQFIPGLKLKKVTVVGVYRLKV